MAMDAGLQLLLMCSEVWVFGLDHPSEGMQAEIALAIRHGIPIIDGAEILSGKKKPERHDELDARLYATVRLHCMEAIAKELKIPLHILQETQENPTTAAGIARYERQRDPGVAAAGESAQRQHQRIQILVAKRRRREE